MKFVALILAASILGGCAAYRKEPLDLKAGWPKTLSRLEIDPSKLPLPELSSRRFDPRDGLDMTEVAMIAVANNPDLKLSRDDAGVMSAQAFAARLLPDPAFGFSPQFPQNGIPGENITAFDLGLSYNLGAVMTRSLRMAAAGSDRQKADLALLWQEWQVAGESRLLFARIRSRQNLSEILDKRRALAARLYAGEKSVFDRKDLTLSRAAAEENALQQIEKQLSENRRLLEKDRHALNALLGLPPDSRLKLVGQAEIALPDSREIAGKLRKLAMIRPDLLALQAGYEAQDLRLRQAILSQFPAIEAGITRSRDNTGINYEGFSLSLTLPIFNRNRGNIAIAEATRKRLHDEFQARLNAAYGEVEQILSDHMLLQSELARIDETLSSLSLLSRKAEAAFRSGDIDLAAYSGLENEFFAKKAEKNAVEESILEEHIALLTLLGPEKESK